MIHAQFKKFSLQYLFYRVFVFVAHRADERHLHLDRFGEMKYICVCVPHAIWSAMRLKYQTFLWMTFYMFSLLMHTLTHAHTRTHTQTHTHESHTNDSETKYTTKRNEMKHSKHYSFSFAFAIIWLCLWLWLSNCWHFLAFNDHRCHHRTFTVSGSKPPPPPPIPCSPLRVPAELALPSHTFTHPQVVDEYKKPFIAWRWFCFILFNDNERKIHSLRERERKRERWHNTCV